MPVGPSLWRRRGNDGGKLAFVAVAGDAEYTERRSVIVDVGASGVLSIAHMFVDNSGVVGALFMICSWVLRTVG